MLRGISNLNKDDASSKNKLELKIENYKLEIAELKNQIPETWTSRNKEFETLHKAKNTRTKRYRKNVDEAYDNLDQISLFINDHEKLKNLDQPNIEIKTVSTKIKKKFIKKKNFKKKFYKKTK